jgi:uncharacterized protein YidB (DUF937 family)
MKRKTMLISTSILAVGVLGTVTAFAATTGTSGSSTANTANTASTASTASVRHLNHRAHTQAFAGADIANILGITPQTLKSDLQNGQSLAQIAQSKGMDEQTLIQKIEDAQKTRLDKAVKNGKLTSNQEQNILTKMDARVKKLVEHKGGFSAHRKLRGAVRAVGINDLTSILGIDKATLQADLKNGESIAEIAQSKGISEGDVVSALKQKLQTKLDAAVTEGKLTSTEESNILKKFSSNIDKVLNHKGTFAHGKKGIQNPNGSGVQTDTNSAPSVTTNA